MESTIKRIGFRVKLSGAQWNVDSVSSILSLRCAYLNGQLSAWCICKTEMHPIYLLSIKLNQFLTNLSNGSKLTQSFDRCFSCQNPVHQRRCQPSFRTFTVEETRFTISGVATSPRSAEVPARKESVFNLLPPVFKLDSPDDFIPVIY